MTTGPALEGLDPAAPIGTAEVVHADGSVRVLDAVTVADVVALVRELAARQTSTPDAAAALVRRLADDLTAQVAELAGLDHHPDAPRPRRRPWSLHPFASVDGAPGDPCPCRRTTPHRSVAIPGSPNAWCPLALDSIARAEDRGRVRVLLAARRLGLRVRRLAADVWHQYDPEDLAELAAVLDAGDPIPEHLEELAELVTVAAETLAVALALEAADRLTVCTSVHTTGRARPPGQTPTRRRVPCRAHLRARSSARSDDPAPTPRRGALVGRPGVSKAGTGARPPT
jgi:hypothetical protein